MNRDQVLQTVQDDRERWLEKSKKKKKKKEHKGQVLTITLKNQEIKQNRRNLPTQNWQVQDFHIRKP